MVEPPTTPGGVKNWAFLGAGLALGYAMSRVIKLEMRIEKFISTTLKVDKASAATTASLVTIAIYLSLAVAMWHKDGALGYFGAGIFGGALADTVLVTIGTLGV